MNAKLQKRNRWIMYAICCLQGMVFYGPIATLYREAVGVTIFQITLIESISLLLCILLELPWGIIADKIGYRRTMLICCGLYFVSKIVFWRANHFWGFLLERIMLSVVLSGMSGVDTSILYLSSNEEESQDVFAIYDNLGMVGLLIAAAVYSVFIGDRYRLAGALTVVSYGMAAVLAFALHEVKVPEKQKQQIGRGFVKLFKQTVCNKKLILLLLAAALLNETHQSITVFLNQLQYIKVGIAPNIIAIIYIGVTLSSLLGGFSGRITRKMGSKKTGSGLFLICSIACLLLAVTHSPVISVIGVLLLRISFSLFQPLLLRIQNQSIECTERASALSIHALFMNGVGIFTNLIYGGVAEYSLSGAMWFGCIICFIGFFIYCRVSE